MCVCWCSERKQIATDADVPKHGILFLKPKTANAEANAICEKEEEREKKKFVVGVLKGRKVLNENLVFLGISYKVLEKDENFLNLDEKIAKNNILTSSFFTKL